MKFEAYTKLENKEIKNILPILNKKTQDNINLEPENITIMSQQISFYKGYYLLDITDNNSVPSIRIFAVFNGDNLVLLDWTNSPIYKLNKDIPISLNDKNVIDYVRFFFNFVKGKHGKFIIVESLDDISWKENPPPSARHAIGKLIKPLTIISKNDDYIIESTVIFKDSLFECTITISKSGKVSIENEKIIIDTMPVYDDIIE